MNKKHKNLFPTNINGAAHAVFGLQSIQPVLLELLPIPPADSAPSPSELSSTRLLNPNEFTIFNSYKLPKRRREYLTGRICAKMAIEKHLTRSGGVTAPIIMRDIEIVSGLNERPAVYNHQPLPRLAMDVSIAHSGNYGAALATSSICGIDIQKQAETLLRVRDRYCTEAEYGLLKKILPDEEVLTRLTLLWAAKEAVKKASSYWQMPGFLDIEMAALEKEFINCISLLFIVKGSKNNHLPKEVRVVTGMFNNYGLAICIIDEEPSDA